MCVLTKLSCLVVLYPAGAPCSPDSGQFIQTEACGSAALNSVMEKTGAVNAKIIQICSLSVVSGL